MLDHVGFGVSDYQRSKAFYEQALAPLGIALLMEPVAQAAGFGRDGKPFFWIETRGPAVTGGLHVAWARGGPRPRPPQQPPPRAPRRNPQPAPGGRHVAFAVEDRETVHAFHAAALEAGGTDNGAPGVREIYHPHYYGAYVLDPDGNNIEAVCHKPA